MRVESVHLNKSGRNIVYIEPNFLIRNSLPIDLFIGFTTNNKDF
jgi:hypothetical protein